MLSLSAQLNGSKLAIRGLERLPQTLDTALATGLQRGLEYTRSIAQTEFLSGPRPSRLDVVTTRLRNSISQDVRIDGRGVIGRIGSNVKYAAFHEFGFSGTINVQAHTRLSAMLGGNAISLRRPIRDRAGNIIGRRRASTAKAPEGTTVSSQQVKAHSRKVNYKGRAYIAPALRKAEPIILAELNKALIAAMPK